MKIAITGHQELENPSDWHWVKSEIEKILASSPQPLIAVSSLAIGADQVFAEAVLQYGGSLQAIIPFKGYDLKFSEGATRQKYNQLLNKASQIEVLSKPISDEEGYYSAGKRIVDIADFVVAVWNGKPARGLGGTADIVKYAKQIGKRVIHINPVNHAVTNTA